MPGDNVLRKCIKEIISIHIYVLKRSLTEKTVITDSMMNDDRQLLEVLNDRKKSSHENTLELRNAGKSHKAVIQIDLENEEKAQMICRILAVDKEPSRSTAKRIYSVREHHLIIEIMSFDAKYLQKSIDNLFDMYYLAKKTIDEVTRYHLKVSNSITDAILGEEEEFDMFKGLKSKLEDEAKRLQATVSQYSENIAQQVRFGVNDTGSDASGQARLLSNSVTTRNSSVYFPDPFSSGNDSDAEHMNEQDPNCSTTMQETREQDLFSESRQRHNSNDSFESENSFNNLFSISGILNSGPKFSTITSDLESESLATSSQFQSASKEQISTVLHKLQGRALNYKNRYRRIIHMYNELVRENEKYRSVLATTQDKALDRIRTTRHECLTNTLRKIVNRQNIEGKEKKAEENKMKELQELMEKCHLSMEKKEERIRELLKENEKLKRNAGIFHDEQRISDLTVQQINIEWKNRVHRLEKEWSKHLSDSEEAGTLAIAKVKAEMHRALEEKDGELQIARARCKVLELSGAELQRQIDELKAAVDALENEKADMVKKLSEAKQQGVKAVQCEEEEKRRELKREMERKWIKEKEENERLFQEMIMKNDEQWSLRFKEQEEQMQLAIEEREMQKVAAVIEHDRKNENLGVQVEQLTAEKLHLKSVLDDMKEKHRQRMEELYISIETNKEIHQQEIHEIKLKEGEVKIALKEDLKAAMKSNKLLEDELRELRISKQKAVEEVENRNEELINELVMERQVTDHLKRQYENDINIIRTKMLTMKENYEKNLKENSTKEELIQRNTEMEALKQELIEFNQKLSSKEVEMKELYGDLKQKTEIIKSLESEKEILHDELASTRELSKIHQHLQQQLKVAQIERDETEKRYLEMEERVEKAVQELEVDRRVLRQEKQELEEKKLNNHQWIEEMNKNKVEEIKHKVQQAQERAQKTENNINEVAQLMVANEQLKNQLEDQQAQIKKLKEEKQSLVKKLEHLKEKAESELKEEDIDMILNERSLILKDVQLEESFVSDAKELSISKFDSLKKKDEILEELRNKLSLLENEKSSFLANIEVLEKNAQEIAKEKNNMMKEMDDIRGSRDNLKIKIKEMEINVRETSCKSEAEVEKLKKELRDQIDETINLRNAIVLAENEIKETSSKLDEMLIKNEELEAMNEKLRIEFFQKESVVNELQKKIKEQEAKENTDLESLKKSLNDERKRQLVLENELTETKENLNKIIVELQRRKNNEEFLEIELNKKRKENKQEQETRNQYALALKNANENLEKVQKQLDDLDLVRIEKDHFIAELSLAKDDYQRIIQQLEQENQQGTEEIKKKAEQKILRIKKQCETNEKAAQTELLLQIDEIRPQIAERDLQIEKQKLNISSLERILFDESKNKKIIDELQATIQMLSSEKDKKLDKCSEMEIQLNSMHATIKEATKQLESQSQQIISLQGELENLNAENMRLRGSAQTVEQLEEERKILLNEKENFGREVERLQLEIVTLQKIANEESAKVSAKIESERHRLLRDLQKEIKQLYHDLNERTQQLNEAKSKLQELSAKKARNSEIDDICHKSDGQSKSLRSNSDLTEQTDYEELCTLREQVMNYQKQLGNTKRTYEKEMTLICEKACCTEFIDMSLESVTNGSLSRGREDLNDNNLVFVEPTEAKYLRNVLYRYMNERETLGKESVTLARVIATVARFTHEQVNAVVAKEEQRNHGWVGDCGDDYFLLPGD
ncbi:Golgin subfamily A member [Dirofilaria immitis]